jgi:hypothetical protein
MVSRWPDNKTFGNIIVFGNGLHCYYKASVVSLTFAFGNSIQQFAVIKKQKALAFFTKAFSKKTFF